MKIENRSTVICFCTLCIFFVFFVFPAYCEDLPIQIRDTGNSYNVTNVGECIIYKLHVRSVPPKKEGTGNFLTRLGAEVAGVGSFSKLLGKIEKGGSISFNRSELTNSDGKKLTDDFVIGALKFEGSTCGECGLTVMFKAE